MYIKTYEHMGQVNTYALLPMSFLCGTFFSTHTLPDALRWFIELLPLTHTSYLLRGIAMNQEVSLLSVGVLLLYLVIVFVIGSKAFLKLRE
jgi:ABC-type polysaccharide/polyol phosphate export permease